MWRTVTPLLAPARLRRGPDIPRAWKTAEAHTHVAGNAQRPHTPGADATQFPWQLGLRDRRCAPAVAWAGSEHGGVVVRARPGHQGQSGSASGLRHHRGAGRARRSTSPRVTCRPTSSGHNVRGSVRVSLGGWRCSSCGRPGWQRRRNARAWRRPRRGRAERRRSRSHRCRPAGAGIEPHFVACSADPIATTCAARWRQLVL